MSPREALRIEEREAISRELSRNRSARFIGALLGRHHSTVSREINRNGGRDDYRAVDAQRRCDGNRARPAVAVSAANTHDSLAITPLVQAIPAIRSARGPRRRRPAKLHADKGYDYPHLRAWLRDRRITPRIARRGIETSEKLGRHRWVIERSLAWLTGYRRLTLRYERSVRLFTAFLTLAATLTCYKKLTT